MEMDSLQSVVTAKVIQALEQIKWSKSQNYVLTIKYQPMDIFMQPVRIETMTTPTAVHIRQAVSHCGKSLTLKRERQGKRILLARNPL
jgi:hypothetical protein